MARTPASGEGMLVDEFTLDGVFIEFYSDGDVRLESKEGPNILIEPNQLEQIKKIELKKLQHGEISSLGVNCTGDTIQIEKQDKVYIIKSKNRTVEKGFITASLKKSSLESIIRRSEECKNNENLLNQSAEYRWLNSN